MDSDNNSADAEKEDNWFVNLVYAYFFVLVGTFFAPIGYCYVAFGDPTWYYNFMIDLQLLPVGVKGYKLYFNWIGENNKKI